MGFYYSMYSIHEITESINFEALICRTEYTLLWIIVHRKGKAVIMR